MKHLFLLLMVAACHGIQAQYVTTVAGGNGPGGNANQFYYPYGVYMDGSGNLYVSDQGYISDGYVDPRNMRVQKFPPGSTSATPGVTVAGGNGPGVDSNQLYIPYGICVDSAGDVYVAVSSKTDDGLTNNRIQMFPAGSSITTDGMTVAGGIGFGGNAGNQLNDPIGVFADAAGNVYVADADNNRILKFPPGSNSATYGVIVAGGGSLGDQPWQLSYPSAVFVDTAGHIYVADYLNNRIQMFSPPDTNGVTVAGGNGMGDSANQLNSPAGLFVDRSGNIYVADFYNNRIQMFPPGSDSATDGITVAGGNGQGSAMNQLNNPTSVYVDGSGKIYIADFMNQRIQMWNPAAAGISNIPAGKGSISLYPNPSQGSFTLVAGCSIGSVYTVRDMLGQLIYQQTIQTDHQTVDLSDAVPGIYVLEVSGAKPIQFVIVK